MVASHLPLVGFDKETTHFYEYDGEVKRHGEIHIDGKKKGKEENDPLPQPEQGQLPF